MKRPHRNRVLVIHNDLEAPPPKARSGDKSGRPTKERRHQTGETERQNANQAKSAAEAPAVSPPDPILLYSHTFRRVYKDAKRHCIVCNSIATYLWLETSVGQAFLCDQCKMDAAKRSTKFVGLEEPIVAGRAVGSAFEQGHRR